MATSNLSRFSKIVTDPLRSFRFLATFTPTTIAGDSFFDANVLKFKAGFTTIQGLSINTQPIGYREGGFNTTLHQIPGMTTFSPLTFQRGTLFGESQGINWMRGLFGAASGDGLAIGSGKSFRCDIEIVVLDHPVAAGLGQNDSISENAEKMKFKVYNAWITSLSYSDLNATDNQLLFETMQVVHEGLSVAFTSPSNQ